MTMNAQKSVQFYLNKLHTHVITVCNTVSK